MILYITLMNHFIDLLLYKDLYIVLSVSFMILAFNLPHLEFIASAPDVMCFSNEF